MPAIEKGGIEFHTLTILLDRALQLADRQIAIRVIEDLVERRNANALP
jgi:hypothetical protein